MLARAKVFGLTTATLLVLTLVPGAPIGSAQGRPIGYALRQAQAIAQGRPTTAAPLSVNLVHPLSLTTSTTTRVPAASNGTQQEGITRTSPGQVHDADTDGDGLFLLYEVVSKETPCPPQATQLQHSHMLPAPCWQRPDAMPTTSHSTTTLHLDQQAGSVSIGMIQTGGYNYPRDRLMALGYSVTLIPPTSGISTFRDYDIVYLPVQWAQAVEYLGIVGDYEAIEVHAYDYLTYVCEGGGLFIDQPNPYGQPNSQVTPTLLPYPITFYNPYEEADYPPTIVDPDHYITRGLTPEEMPFPADQIISVDSFYHTLVLGRLTGSASLVVGEYGKGRILIQTAHPSTSSLVKFPFSDEVYTRMIEWLGTGGEPVLSISHIEVTQATQDESNSVPIIAGKPTFVRVYVDCGVGCTSLPNVTGVLRGYGSSGELPDSPLTPVNRSITAHHPEDWQDQRGDLDKTLNFTIPPEWRTGTITLTAEINAATSSQVVSFRPAQTPSIIYVPIRYRGQNPDLSRIRNGFWWALRVYPTDHLQYTPMSTIEWALCLGSDCDNVHVRDFHERLLLLRLALMYRFYNLRSEPDADYIFGWLPGGTLGGGPRGFSAPPWHAAVGEDHPTETQRVFSHETGHLMGHMGINTDDCPSNDPGTGWPHSNAKIRDFGLDGYGFGWLVSSSSAVKDPTSTYDYMSYCGSLTDGDVWTSSWTYEHIYSETLESQTTYSITQFVSTPQSYFIASGLVYTDDTATLNPIWVVTTTITPENPPEGTQYCLEAQDASSTPLVSRCFDLTFVNYETGEATNVDGFNLMLPYPDGVARIVLKKGSQELAVRSVSANAPVVAVLSPNGGETWATSGVYTITWSADDTDDDPLTYSVLYSPDGSNWVPVGAIITQTQLAVDAAELAGGNAARIRVLASDGINTSSDESDGAFTVGQKPPSAYILSPEGDIAVLPDSVLWFHGYAYDLEDGVMEGSALQWSSNRDGVLGTGSEALLTLSPGQHLVTLTATDSDGKTAMASVSVYAGCKAYLPLILRNR